VESEYTTESFQLSLADVG